MYKVFVDGELFCDARSDALSLINPVVTLEVNKAGSFTFTIPKSHPYRDDIQPRKSLIDVYMDDEEEPTFEGVCATVNEDFYGQRKVVAEGELIFLSETVLRQAHREGLTSRQLLEAYINEHNSKVDDFKKFTVGIVTAKNSTDHITCFTNYNSTMQEIKEDLVDDIGGYLRVRHENGQRILDYLKESPRTASQTIKLGENLLDYESNLDTSDLCTALIPLGARLETQAVAGLDAYLTIESVNDGKDYIYSSTAVGEYGYIEKVKKWDDVTLPSNLLAKAQEYLSDAQFSDVSITVNAVDLHYDNQEVQRFKLLDKIRVISQAHGMDRYFMLTKQVINLAEPDNDTFTLGTEGNTTMSAKSAEVSEEIKSVPQTIDSAVSNATALITGSKGGYVKFKVDEETNLPSEILIMDTNDEATATNIWRWNKNGFGYSNDGGQTYGTAITMDGSIVADYISAGSIVGIEIRSNGSVTRYAGDYNADDVTRVNDLILFKIDPTEEDYEKYDFDNSRSFDASDLIKTNLLATNQKESIDIDTTVSINAEDSKSVIKTSGVDIGANYVSANNLFSEKNLSVEKNSNVRVFDEDYGTYGGYLYGISGTYSNISKITVKKGIVTSISGTLE